MTRSDRTFSGHEGRTPDVSLLKTLIERAESTPHDVYVIDIDDDTLSYLETVEKIAVWAGAYRRFGVASGEHVVTMQLNTIDSMLGYRLGKSVLGVWKARL